MNKYKLTFYFSILCWLLFLIWVLAVPARSEAPAEQEPLTHKEMVIHAIISASDVDKPAEPQITYEDWFRSNANVITGCMVTHYCCERYEHICGTGDGLTSTGVSVTPYWTCAVDPSVIPYGSEVMVDYGDRFEFYQAQDCGSAIDGNHIDLAVETHGEAELLGITYATVYWMEVEREFG